MRIGSFRPFLLLLITCLPVYGVFAQTAPRLLEQGRSALAEGVPRFDEDMILQAADHFRRALELNPRYADARSGLAEALLWLGDYEQAEDQIRRARALRYTDVGLDLIEARLLILTDRIEGARSIYNRVLQREPYNTDAQVGRAILSMAEGATERMVGNLQMLEQRFPENRQLLTALVEISWARGDVAAGERYLATALRYHGDSPSVQIVAARVALDRGDPERAEIHARNTVTLAPSLDEGWMILAHAAYLQGRPEEARTHYEQLISLDPENHRAWYARGILAADTGNASLAYSSWERSLRIRPDYELARIARENTLVAREPLDSPLRAEAALSYRRTGRDLEERFLHRQAERHYRRGLQINPFDTVLRRNLAELYLAQGFRGRYLQELEIIADLANPGRELTDLIETFRNLRRDSLAVRWDIDQFTAPRSRTSIALFYRDTTGTTEPRAAHHAAEYLASLLRTSQNISVATVEQAHENRVRSISRARELGADRVLIVTVGLPPNQVRIRAELLDRQSGEGIFNRTIVRDGLGRLERGMRDLATLVAGEVVPVGTVLERTFDSVLISLGTVDGLDRDDSILFGTTPGSAQLGSGTVIALDDLLAEVRFTPDGPDTLTTGHFARLASDEIPPENDTASPAIPTSDEQLSDFTERMKHLFRLP